MKDRELQLGSRKRVLTVGAWILTLTAAAIGGFVLIVGVPAGGWDTGVPISVSSLWLFICFLLLATAAGAGVALLLRSSRGKRETGAFVIPEGHPHPGISMHRMKTGGGMAGFIFAAGSVLIFLLGIPAFWGFLGLALVGGTGVALFLRKRKALRIVTISGGDSRRL